MKFVAPIVVALIAVACGPNPPESARPLEVLPAKSWSPLSADTVIDPESGGFPTISVGSPFGYKAGYTIETKGARSLLLSYDVTLRGGPAQIGVLKADGSAWIENYTLHADADNSYEIEIPISEPHIQLVFQTSELSAASTQFLINNFEYAIRK